MIYYYYEQLLVLLMVNHSKESCLLAGRLLAACWGRDQVSLHRLSVTKKPF